LIREKQRKIEVSLIAGDEILRNRKRAGYLLTALCALLLLAAAIPFAMSRHYFVEEGNTVELPKLLSAVLDYELFTDDGLIAADDVEDYAFEATGEYSLAAKLFGFFPVRSSAVSVYEVKELVPGGQSVGLIMKTEGVVVVGYSAVTDENGKTVYPAKEAGISLGDCITKINGVTVTGDDDVMALIDSGGSSGEIFLEIKRNGETQIKKVKSYPCAETGRFRIGLYVRDNTGGVGTMTFYNPETNRYGALGHTVTEAVSSNEDKLYGRILPASISGINAAGNGNTGEKIGYFNPGAFEGEIDRVGIYGVFGTLDAPLENELLPVTTTASPDEVKKGAAQIITVLNGDTMEWFDIEITDINPDDETGKGLAITITDEALLTKTGGIIQGMSGSPIIQNDKLVGAVTYVMVNQPKKGYGCLIHYMLEEGDIS